MGLINKHLEEISVMEGFIWKSPYSTENDTSELDMPEYRRKFPSESSMWFPMATEEGIGYAGSRTSGEVMMSPLYLIRSLMCRESWKNLFPCIVVNASMVPGGREFVYPEINKDTESASLEIQAEIQVLSPLAGRREMIFERSCHRLEDGGGWLVVDLPISLRKIAGCRQLPFIRSCLVRPSSTTVGLSHVIWIEMFQSRCLQVHPWYREVSWSLHWFGTLSRECQRLANHGHCFSPLPGPHGTHFFSSSEKFEKRLVLLANRMTSRFYSAVRCSTPRNSLIADDADQSIWFGKDLEYKTGAKSTSFKVKLDKFFHVLLSSVDKSGLLGHEIVRIPCGDKHNCVSLHHHIKDKHKRALREVWFDPFGAGMVIASLDSDSKLRPSSITTVSGFVVHSDNNTHSSILTTGLSYSTSCDNWKRGMSKNISSFIKDIGQQILV